MSQGADISISNQLAALRTIQFHLNSIFNKTSTSSRTEAVALALRQGWLEAS